MTTSSREGILALPPLRSDAPGRLGAAPAALPDLATAEERDDAVRVLEQEAYAASSLRKQTTFWNTIVRALGKWDLEPFPPTKAKLTCLGAALKLGRYTTANQ